MNRIRIGFIFIINVLMIFKTNCQQYLVKPDTLKIEDKKIVELLTIKPILILTVDFTGDSKSDFICRIKSDRKDKGNIKEIWIDHYYKVLKTVYRGNYEFDYCWFLNTRANYAPKLIRAFGWTEGINYAIYDQDLKNGKDNLILYFNPVIIDSTQTKTIYWGYPWDIKDIELINVRGNIQLLCSVDHDIKTEGEREKPDFQKLLPVICFKGKSTQPDINVGEIRKMTWISLQELKIKVIKPH